MDALNVPLVWRRNAPDPAYFTLYGENGIPVDLTGMTMRLQVRLQPGAPGAPLVTLGMAPAGQPGISIDDAAGGSFTITPPTSATLLALPAQASVSGPPLSLAYDLLLIHSDGVTEPFTEGAVSLPMGVTI